MQVRLAEGALLIADVQIDPPKGRLRRHVALAQEFAGWVREDPRFELAAPVPLNLVCFRHRGGETVNQRILDALNASGKLHLTHTRLDGKLTLRFSIGQTTTERRHVERAWQLIRDESIRP
jgi:aromatic-L-amino-acid decarboxylase